MMLEHFLCLVRHFLLQELTISPDRKVSMTSYDNTEGWFGDAINYKQRVNNKHRSSHSLQCVAQPMAILQYAFPLFLAPTLCDWKRYSAIAESF